VLLHSIQHNSEDFFHRLVDTRIHPVVLRIYENVFSKFIGTIASTLVPTLNCAVIAKSMNQQTSGLPFDLVWVLVLYQSVPPLTH